MSGLGPQGGVARLRLGFGTAVPRGVFQKLVHHEESLNAADPVALFMHALLGGQICCGGGGASTTVSAVLRKRIVIRAKKWVGLNKGYVTVNNFQ